MRDIERKFKETEIGLIPEDWEILTVSDISEKVGMGPFGSSIKVETFVDSGVPVVSGQHLHGNKLEDSDYNFVTTEHANRLKNSIVVRGDVIFTHAGNIGQVAFVPTDSEYERYVLSQRQFFLRPDTNIALPEFITYFFKSPVGQHILLSNRSQTGVPSISRPVSFLRTVKVPIPELSEQEKIVGVLSVLDDKIELNRQINANLEQIAGALFKRWFVDFEFPDENGRPYKSSGGKMVESEQGEIPENWTRSPLSEITRISGGGTPKTSESDYWDGDIPWFSVVDVPRDADVFVIDTEKKITAAGIENSAAEVLSTGTTIVTARGTVGKIALIGVPMAINQSCYGLSGKIGNKGYYNYLTIKNLVALLKNSAHGSVFDTITRETFSLASTIVPPSVVVDAYENAVAPLFKKIQTNLFENKETAQIADRLLPKLVSGRVRVP